MQGPLRIRTMICRLNFGWMIQKRKYGGEQVSLTRFVRTHILRWVEESCFSKSIEFFSASSVSAEKASAFLDSIDSFGLSSDDRDSEASTCPEAIESCISSFDGKHEETSILSESLVTFSAFPESEERMWMPFRKPNTPLAHLLMSEAQKRPRFGNRFARLRDTPSYYPLTSKLPRCRLWKEQSPWTHILKFEIRWTRVFGIYQRLILKCLRSRSSHRF
ncbi:hypothetical protein BC829DRAFT_184834 [Chytridium lagenaria]|nr:hypothetical protein BC829DRAFT_184834 [Chytridium lagenaria]